LEANRLIFHRTPHREGSTVAFIYLQLPLLDGHNSRSTIVVLISHIVITEGVVVLAPHEGPDPGYLVVSFVLLSVSEIRRSTYRLTTLL
jgi:hypothetical protein